MLRGRLTVAGRIGNRAIILQPDCLLGWAMHATKKDQA